MSDISEPIEVMIEELDISSDSTLFLAHLQKAIDSHPQELCRYLDQHYQRLEKELIERKECPQCGSGLAANHTQFTSEYAGHERTMVEEQLYCSYCGYEPCGPQWYSPPLPLDIS